MKTHIGFTAVLLTLCHPALACDLTIREAWIREAPATSSMLAGYGLLTNTGKTALTVKSVQSAAFAQVEMHESTLVNGVASMRALPTLSIAAGETVTFAPNGKHFMLINPKPGLRAGDSVVIKLQDASGCETTARFKVARDAASATEQMDHSKMDHSKMDHSQMHHGNTMMPMNRE